jgi:hypothetical protein
LKNTKGLSQGLKNFKEELKEKEVASYAVSRSSGRLKDKFVVLRNVQRSTRTETKTGEFTETENRISQSLLQNYT